MYFKGFLKLSLAHHPLCWQYRNHVIRIRSIPLCLGCSGFYTGFIISIFLIVLGCFQFMNWSEMVIISFVFYLPTMLRLIKVLGFSTSKRTFRFFMRFFLGIGIGTGLFSIAIAPDILVQISQILLGLGLYIGITIARIKDTEAWKECETCTYVRNSNCFGFKPFYYPNDKELLYKLSDTIPQESHTN